MTTEHGPHYGPDKMPFLKKLWLILTKRMHEVKMEEIIKKGEEAYRGKARYETREEWEREEERRREEDAGRAYHEAKSSQIAEAQAEVIRIERARAVTERFDQVMRDPREASAGSAYLVVGINPDENVKAALKRLIAESPSAAEVINDLFTKETELHNSASELTRYAQRLSYEAGRATSISVDEIRPVLNILSQRVKELFWEEWQNERHQAGRRGARGPAHVAQMLKERGVVLTKENEEKLSKFETSDGSIDEVATKREWTRAIESVVTTPHRFEVAEASWAEEKKIPKGEIIPEKIAPSLANIWGEITRREGSPDKLSVRELLEYEKQIRREEAKLYPRDVAPGSAEFESKVSQIREVAGAREGMLDALAAKLRERLRGEAPVVREGIVNPEEFLKEMVVRKGRLGDLLVANKEMYKLFTGIGDESRRFRDRAFLKIHSGILLDQRNSSEHNFGLYERADFTSFIDLLRAELGDFKDKETGLPLGQVLGDHYNNLSNAVRQSRDIDFWASQPGATSENFNKSLILFQNEYVKEALIMPGVNAAFRAYETVLRSIISSNDGYLPPALIDYDPVTRTSFWDNQSRAMVEKMMDMRVVPGVVRDEGNFFLHKVHENGYTLVTDTERPLRTEDVSDDEMRMYMTLAKGFGVATGRYLELMAQTKVPGSKHPTMGIEGFHSMPYEGVVKALNFFNVFIHKWSIGAYKYFYLLNQLIPEGKKINFTPNDSREVFAAYNAYIDGTFVQRYGEDAKRFIDLTNFSGISSAIGKNTRWRQVDATIGWSDEMRELLGGSTQLVFAGIFAEEKVKDFLVIDKYRERYRQEIIERNRSEGLNLPTSGAGFDKLWKDYGRERYGVDITRDWDELKGMHPKKGKRETALFHDTQKLIDTYTTAFKARIWAEMAMRNPLITAHSLTIDVPLVGVERGKPKKMTLHKMLVQDILGIPPEDIKYDDEHGVAAYGKTPSERQRAYMANVLNLEGDLAAVKELAINEGRDLTADDFRRVITDEGRQRHALAYWQRVRQVILGTDDITAAERLYDNLGLKLKPTGYYEWDREKIHNLTAKEEKEGYLNLNAWERELNKRDKKGNLIVPRFTIIGQDGQEIRVPFLLKEAIGMQPEWILGTDDMALGKMDFLNLGSRQLLRRGGDIASHEAGGNAVVEYLRHGIIPMPDNQKLAEMLNKVVDAYSGDMIEMGWSVAGNMAYMTDRLYAWNWKRMGSAAQLDVWKTRRNVAARLANGRREFWDAIEHADVLPPHAQFYGYPHIEEKWTIHDLRKKCYATNVDVFKEIIALGMLAALAITIYRALTAPSEEEEGGHH